MKECPKCGARYSNDATFCSKDASSLVEMSADSDILGMLIDGRWRVDSKLGEGGMGAVYLGHQVNIDRKVAIKTLRRELTSSVEFMARFEQEARAAGRISHPNCVTVFESGRADSLGGMLYLVMEYLDGEVLSGRLERQQLTLEEALRVAIQVASGLAAAHEVGIIHRDLKPDNIFLVNVPGDDLHAKVLDFGIAKVSDGDSKMTKSGMIMGTPQYMSPEQCHGRPVDVRTDIYSLGTILYELVSGRTPFNSPTPITVLFEVVNSPPPSLTSLGVVVPKEVDAYVMRMLSKDAADRPSSAMEVKRELERLLTVSSQTVSSPMEALLATSDTVAMPRSSAPVTATHTPPKKTVGILIAAVLLVVLIAGAYAVAQMIENKDVSEPVAEVAAPAEVPMEPESALDSPTAEDVETASLAAGAAVSSGLELARATNKAPDKVASTAKNKPTANPPVVVSKPKAPAKVAKKPERPKRDALDELREARKNAKGAAKKVKKARKDLEAVLDDLGP